MEKRDLLNHLVGAFQNAESSRAFERNLVPHPYFGYVYRPGIFVERSQRSNNFGFGTPYDFEATEGGYKLAGSSKDEFFTVGIFGGSVACNCAFNSKYLERKLEEKSGNRKVRVVNMAIPGHAMPQSLFIYNIFRSLFDATVFIDGLNEIWNPCENNIANVSLDSAKAWHYRYLLGRDSLTAKSFAITQRILALKRAGHFVTQLSLRPIIGSVFSHSLWKNMADYVFQEIKKAESSLIGQSKSKRKFSEMSDEAIVVRGAANWLAYSRISHSTSTLEGKKHYHFLQPNPFVDGSKNLTLQEENVIKNFYGLDKYVRFGYGALQNGVADLRSEGVEAESLVNLFQDESDDIWIDGCHMNQKGNLMVLDRIAERVAL